VFSLPIETVALDAPITATRLLGYLFCLTTLLQPGLCFRGPPAAFWCFATFLGGYATLGAFQPLEYLEEVLERLFTFTQLLVLFWISSNVMRDREVVRGALLTLGVSGAVFAALQLAGVTGAARSIERASALGQNPNEVAGIFALGLLALLGLAYAGERGPTWLRLFGWPLYLLLGLAIIQTGSRGGLAALGAGLVALLFAGGGPRLRARNALIVLASLGVLLVVAYFSEGTRYRWEQALESGDLAHREQLYPAAWGMFLEKPLLGWGPVTHLYELGGRVAWVHWQEQHLWRDTHALVFYLVTATGILGAIPFIAGLVLCWRAAWQARRGPEGPTPLALVVVILVMNLVNTWIFLKVAWVLMAYAVASAGPFLPVRWRAGGEGPALPAVTQPAGTAL
jgi:O-antigen ligase